jgi:hypothetical protein
MYFGYANVWDDGYPSGGNFWSDYAGVDLFSGPLQNETGRDGIGDTAYVIDEDNVDRYPLINPWSPIPVKVFDIVWENAHYPVTVQSNSSVTHFIFNQSLAQIGSNLSGSSGVMGYCNLTIPKSLMRGPWNYTFEGDVLGLEIMEAQNETHTFISFKYTHESTFRITTQATWVIPEFSSTIILIFIVLFSAIFIVLKKHLRRKI